MRQKLTPAFVMNPPAPKKDRTVYWDTEQVGLGLRVTATGHKSWVIQYRVGGRGGTERKVTLAATVSLANARKEAKKLMGDVAKGVDPVAEKRRQEEAERKAREAAEATARAAEKIAIEAESTTVKAILESYLAIECGMTRDAAGNATFDGRKRSGSQKLDCFERLVYPEIGAVQIMDITHGDEIVMPGVKRAQIVKMLDKIEKENGPVMADRTLAHVRRALNWYAARTNDFNSPIVKGMAKTKPGERAGERVLADDEIRDIWTVCEKTEKEKVKDLPAAFVRLQRGLFLSASRRTEAAALSWFEMETLDRDDYKGDAWTCPKERMKGKRDHLVPVTSALSSIIGDRPKDWRDRPYVFSTTGGRLPFSSYSKSKKALDRQIAALRKKEGREPMQPWTMQQDVRRTARTLMTRAGVSSEVAERVIAHKIKGVEGVYNKYEYVAEKHDALTRLAALIDRIVHPRNNVTAVPRSGVLVDA
jgi:integrase